MGRRFGAVAASAALGVAGLAVAIPSAHATDWGRCVSGSQLRQDVFTRAARVSGVPVKVLLGVSYMESRWDDHGTSPSTSGGYGVMHLTLRTGTDPKAAARGEQASTTVSGTLPLAARLTGMSRQRLIGDDAANICGGAAVLASYAPRVTSAQPRAWSAAVARYADAKHEADAQRFTHEVFSVLRQGESRVTNDGQRVTLAATPGAMVDTKAVDSRGLTADIDTSVVCPASLGCESVPAPYEWYGYPDPYAYGNFDYANRPNDIKIDYIVIHDTEGSYDTALNLVQDPTYLGWHYTIRSSDGHVAAHINPANVGWHAGNWYVNMHSIGVEHEGFAASGATWYTEALYESSATLVRYLALKYGVPIDRAHIIGHDQVPGILPAYVAGMHWDPGPYWDWEHYMSLLGAPLKADRRGTSNVVTVAPHFDDNPQTVTGCTTGGSTCPTQGTNFVYLHTAPSSDAPLVKDAGLHTDGSYSTTGVSDIGARVDAGQKLVVAQTQGSWLGVWYLGAIGWMQRNNAAGESVVQPSSGTVVKTAGTTDVPVYGRAFPEASAYPSDIPVQTVAPLQYTIKPGQAYVLADSDPTTDYYYATTYDDSAPNDHTDVVGKDRYYEIWFGHRVAFVRAADVVLAKG